jgi:exodeoxyribonuclease III
MRVITYNVNGIRAAMKKGFLDWLNTDPADVICLQEIKAHEEDVPKKEILTAGYETYSYSAQKKGYSGVAILTKIRPDNVFYGNGIPQSDSEGRVIRAMFGNVAVINAYFPSGTSGEERQTYKYQWLDEFLGYLQSIRSEIPQQIICGDYNICHKPIDIHDPVGNKRSSGFLPEERQWMDKFFAAGYIDSFRVFHQEPHQYTWWSNFAKARDNNKGWRIDYISVTEPLTGCLKNAVILPDVKHSDHCPMFLELQF